MFGFKIGSIPVRVHPVFFLTVAMFGGALGPHTDLGKLALWVTVAFVGVLAHELAHALMGMRFGLIPAIELIGFGGLTSYTAAGPVKMTTGRRVAISLAGPLTSVAIGGAVFVWMLGHAARGPVETALAMIVDVNLGWGIFNLLPILPMDGGNVLLALLQKATNGHGEMPARIVSIVLATLGALFYVVYRHDFVGAIFVAAFFVLPHVQWFRARSAPPAVTRPDVQPPRF